MNVEIVFTVQGSATIELPDDLLRDAATALAPGPDEEPDAYDVWEWIKMHRSDWIRDNARGGVLLDAADLDLPGESDIEQENPEGRMPDWFYAQNS